MLIFSVYMQNNAISCQLEPELKNVHAELEKCQFAPYTKQITISSQEVRLGKAKFLLPDFPTPFLAPAVTVWK